MVMVMIVADRGNDAYACSRVMMVVMMMVSDANSDLSDFRRRLS
jgi:hypothetical protein